MAENDTPFNIIETTIDDVHAAYKSGRLTCRQLMQMYIDRIEAFDKRARALTRSSRSIPKRWQKPIVSMPPTKCRARWDRCTAFR